MTTPEFCPECGESMKNRDPEAEGMRHWGVRAKDIDTLKNQEAQRRYRILMTPEPIEETTTTTQVLSAEE